MHRDQMHDLSDERIPVTSIRYALKLRFHVCSQRCSSLPFGFYSGEKVETYFRCRLRATASPLLVFPPPRPLS